MENNSRSRKPLLWLLAAVLIVANFWYDYHHPLGILFDLVLGVLLLIGYLSKSSTA